MDAMNNDRFPYPRGSEWRKWDLQLEPTKQGWFQDLRSNRNRIEMATRAFLQKAIDKDLKVIAITDHNTGIAIDEALKVVQDLNLDIVVLPGIEIDMPEGWHIIVIFNPAYKEKTGSRNWEEAINSFLRNVIGISGQVFNGTIPAQGTITTKDLIRRVWTEDIGVVIFPHCNRGKGFFLRGSTNSRREVLEEVIKNNYGIIFDIKNGMQEEIKQKIGNIFNDQNWQLTFPVISTSDAHDANQVGDSFTWIKADPTFEGLKQIVYEPEERIRIQKENPEFDFNKPTFNGIVIDKPIKVFEGGKVEFKRLDLPLNKNLVTIIGGRGTGKSLLINYLAHTFNKEILAYKNKKGPFELTHSQHFKVIWSKNNHPQPDTLEFNARDKGNLDFIFIEQGKLKNISDYRILAEEIKKLLGIENLQFPEKLDKEITDLLENIKKLKEWFEYENEKREKINSRDFNERKKKRAQNLLKAITTKENKKKLELYTSNIKLISQCTILISSLNDLKDQLLSCQQDLKDKIEDINSKIPDELKKYEIPIIGFEQWINKIKEVKEALKKVLEKKKKENTTIKEEFEKLGYKGDLETLLRNAAVYQKDIQEAEEKLKQIENKERLLKEKLNERRNLGDRLRKEYERQVKEIEKAWDNLFARMPLYQRKIIKKLLQKREIEIEGRIVFDYEKFDEKLKEYLDLRVYKNPAQQIGIKTVGDYWKFIKTKLQNYIEGNYASHTKKPLDLLFFDLKERREYLYVVPEIKFMGKTLDQLSVGQRGTLYLLFQLATNTFSSPLIFDQPEDDLDNEFITKELVDIFREIKKYRQIIIVTHNANLVVTTDAEQIIVAVNENEKLSYYSGSLENPVINESVCKILEGGKEAFEKRRNKYQF